MTKFNTKVFSLTDQTISDLFFNSEEVSEVVWTEEGAQGLPEAANLFLDNYPELRTQVSAQELVDDFLRRV